MKQNGQAFWLTNQKIKNPDGTIVTENSFVTTTCGWTKPDGELLKGRYKSVVISKNGEIIQSKTDIRKIDSLPKLIELG